MSDKIVIIKGGRVFAWFADSDLIKENNVTEYHTTNDVMNHTQKKTWADFMVRSDIKLTIDQSKEEQSILVDCQSNVMQRNGKDIALRTKITMFDDKREERDHSGICFYWTKKGLKKVPMSFKEVEYRPLLVLSTLEADVHGRLTKIANTKSPAQALKYFLRSEALNCREQGADVHAENFLRNEIIREMWFTNGELHTLEYNVTEEGLLNGRPIDQQYHLMKAFG